MRKWTENEEMERDLLSTFPQFLFISPISIHFQIKNCLILSQNVKYGTFIANLNISKVGWGPLSVTSRFLIMGVGWGPVFVT